MPDTYPQTLVATAKLNVRAGAPSTTAAAVAVLEAGDHFRAIDRVTGDSFGGYDQWYALDGDRYVWGGASRTLDPAAVAPAPGMDVPYRSDVPGAINVLSDAERARCYGAISGWTEGPQPGAITLPDGWEAAHIVTIDTPIAQIGRLEVHRLAAQPFQNVFRKIVAAGLDDRILHCDGTFVPRHKGWNPKRGLSSHTWGIAIDLNARWNAYGKPPAALGQIGCNRELIPVFRSEGFAWGGYFSGDDVDGMHFELARRDLGAD